MTGEHPNATAYRRTADAFRSGNEAELVALMTDDVVWHVPAWEQIFADCVRTGLHLARFTLNLNITTWMDA